MEISHYLRIDRDSALPLAVQLLRLPALEGGENLCELLHRRSLRASGIMRTAEAETRRFEAAAGGGKGAIAEPERRGENFRNFPDSTGFHRR